MPTITVEKDRFFNDLGKKFTHEEFDDMLFDYGLELDEDTSITTPDEKPYKLKIEVPANRYDLLCHQGLILSLRTYIGTTTTPPTYRSKIPTEPWKVIVRKETSQIRPFLGSAILRGVKFDEQVYKDFIDLQDKLHGNLCRKRTLVAIGTHDLNKIDHASKVLSYEAKPPQDIKFAPLNKEIEYDATQLMTLYESDKHLSKYLHIIRDSPVYPIIYDNSKTVLSMPPIINSNATKITLDTQDVFIEVTATDQTKLDIVINVIITMFAQYCSEPFTVEPVDVVYEHDLAKSYRSPNLESPTFTLRRSYTNSITGLNLTREEIVNLLQKMGHQAMIPTTQIQTQNSTTSNEIINSPIEDLLIVTVPITRHDILHECDLIEDVAIGYGFNKLDQTFPNINTIAKPYEINKLSDLIRKECAFAGWTEVLPLTLCSHDENFKHLNRTDDGKTAVVLSNPTTIEFQVVRTSLLPGLLKTLKENRKEPLPIKVFEVSDIVLKDESLERKAKNVRRLSCAYVNKKAGFEIVHGFLDRIMNMLEIVWSGSGDGEGKKGCYWLEESDDPTFFPGRSAKILYKPNPQPDQKQKKLKEQSFDGLKSDLLSSLEEDQVWTIGQLGILHPDVIKNFDLDYPCSTLEIDLSYFL